MQDETSVMKKTCRGHNKFKKKPFIFHLGPGILITRAMDALTKGCYSRDFLTSFTNTARLVRNKSSTYQSSCYCFLNTIVVI